MNNILPTFPLPEREKPYQKITVKKMPEMLKDKLADRAKRMNKEIHEYCRIVIEHACHHQAEYAILITEGMMNGRFSPGEVSIPMQGKAFLEKLRKWDPFGDRDNSKIAVSLLTKHLEVRSW